MRNFKWIVLAILFAATAVACAPQALPPTTSYNGGNATHTRQPAPASPTGRYLRPFRGEDPTAILTVMAFRTALMAT